MLPVACLCPTSSHSTRISRFSQIFVGHGAVLTVVGDRLEGIVQFDGRFYDVQTGTRSTLPLTLTPTGDARSAKRTAQTQEFAPEQIERWTDCYSGDETPHRALIVCVPQGAPL